MKVKDLIVALKKENQEADVYIDQINLQEISSVFTAYCVDDACGAPILIEIKDDEDEKEAYGIPEDAERVVGIE